MTQTRYAGRIVYLYTRGGFKQLQEKTTKASGSLYEVFTWVNVVSGELELPIERIEIYKVDEVTRLI